MAESRGCPFHTIVVTSPDSESAKAASDGPLNPSSSLLPTLRVRNDVNSDTRISNNKPLKPSSLEEKKITDDDDDSHVGNNSKVQIYSTSDPFDTRVGSGGGTLAALDIADGTDRGTFVGTASNKQTNSECTNRSPEKSNGSVLIIHAGGQSSRCPTQITLGKAWTSLPTENNTITNPTYILIESLSKVLADLPNGSVVVAASDVLLSLPMQNPISFDEFLDHNKVLGLAVPAPLETAKNHGVFVLGGRNAKHEKGNVKQKNDDNLLSISIVDELNDCVKPIDAFLQKPSVESMENFASGNCVFEKNEQDMAWIDTGVIIFLPKAAQVLRDMMCNDLSVCTKSGIEKMYQEKLIDNHIVDKEGSHDDDDDDDDDNNDAPKDDICNFAKEVSVKVELYSHLLLAIPTKGSFGRSYEERLTRYLSDSINKDLSPNLLKYIFKSFAEFELQVCVIPDGGFIHLGTTNELRRFLIYGATTTNYFEESEEIRSCRDFGRRIGVANKSHVIENDAVVDSSCVLLNSTFPCSNKDSIGNASIGSGTVIEHSVFGKDNFAIGSNCLISGFRGIWKGHISIPDNFVFQFIKLKSNWKEVLGFNNDSGAHEEENFVCIYHHINDAIKAQTTCFGVSFEELFQRTELNTDDIWEKQEKKCLLWNAKINPIIKKDAKGQFNWSILSWIENLDTPQNDNFRMSLDEWKSHQRMSLAQLRSVADASFEFSSRMNLQSTLVNACKLQKSLIERLNKEIDIESALLDDNIFVINLSAMEKIVVKSIKEDMNDICSRAFILTSAMLRDFSYRNADKGNSSFQDDDFSIVVDYEMKILSSDSDFDSKRNALRNVFNCCEDLVNGNSSIERYMYFANALEELGHSFTKSCVAPGVSVRYRQSYCPIGHWAVAKAPARIDIFGGWSDTPPISYEYGGSVACLSVLVNEKMPLYAKCRQTESKCGIVLRSESRDIDSDELLWYEQVHVKTIKDLSDYNDPTACCALLKCALLIYGLVPFEFLSDDNRSRETIQPFLEQMCNKKNFGLELISISLLPKGSGMGSSSILAGCILASLGNCIGLHFGEDHEDRRGLTKAILLLEQLLTTGGGWQDQVGGLYGGLKLGTSEKHKIPMEVQVKQYDIPKETIHELNRRMILVFMGQPRLAKNILRNVLKQWSTRQRLIMKTVNELVHGANDAVTALENNDICKLGELFSEYWQKKMTMAGKDSGVEPPLVRNVINILQENKIIDGATLCGAGGGGFLVAIAKKGKTQEDAKKCIETHASRFPLNIDNFAWFECDVSCDGLTISIEE